MKGEQPPFVTRVTNLDDGRKEADLLGYLLRIEAMFDERVSERGNSGWIEASEDCCTLRLEEDHDGDSVVVRAKTIYAHTPTIAADMAFSFVARWP